MVGLVQELVLDFIETAAGPEAVARVKQRARVPLDRVFHLDVRTINPFVAAIRKCSRPWPTWRIRARRGQIIIQVVNVAPK